MGAGCCRLPGLRWRLSSWFWSSSANGGCACSIFPSSNRLDARPAVGRLPFHSRQGSFRPPRPAHADRLDRAGVGRAGGSEVRPGSIGLGSQICGLRRMHRDHGDGRRRFDTRHNYSSFSPLAPDLAFQTSWRQFKEGARIAAAPQTWLDEQYARSRQAAGRLAASANLPALAETVDIIPSRQSQVIAAGLNYRPRPTIQEHATDSSAALIARNKRFFESEGAPDYLSAGVEHFIGHIDAKRFHVALLL